MPPTAPHDQTPSPVTRRLFLRRAGTAAAAVSLGGVGGCVEADEDAPPTAQHVQEPPGFEYDAVPPTPEQTLDTSMLHFFTATEAATMDALVARILPGTAADPGAREAGVVGYIDLVLGTHDGGFATGIYRQPPFAETYEGDAPPAGAAPTTIWVRKDELERYGYQSALNYREIFRLGLMSFDAFVTGTAGGPFAGLAEAQQDELIAKLADGSATGFREPTAKLFFQTVRDHVIEGFFADPVYGGNRDMAGWQLVDYPGAQRAYTPEDIAGRTPVRSPQSICDLHPFNPGVAGGTHAVLPVSGSRDGAEGSEHP